MRGTQIPATVKRVVDGDTIWVEEFNKSIRVLSLDTEESAGTTKPVTRWGKAATEYATARLSPGTAVVLEFQGQDLPERVWERYVDNYGRGLAWVHLPDGTDFQEEMIRLGYSPYFSKYGYAEWPELHARYQRAEAEAQARNVGVWNQLVVNGGEMRNYAVLGVWWDLRARLIESYRHHNATTPIYNTRKDYLELCRLAPDKPTVTLFTELRSVRRVGGKHAAVFVGSNEQPFSIFIPNMDDLPATEILSLLRNRYLPSATESYPRRGYAYVEGRLELFRDRPQLVLASAAALRDDP